MKLLKVKKQEQNGNGNYIVSLTRDEYYELLTQIKQKESGDVVIDANKSLREIEIVNK